MGHYDDTQIFQYDSENRLIKVEVGPHHRTRVKTLEFKYDVIGRRTQKTVYHEPSRDLDRKIIITDFWWNGMQMCAEANLARKRNCVYIYNDQTYASLARVEHWEDYPDRDKVSYFHNNINGCPEQMTNEKGEIIWNASLTLFGKTQKEYLHDDCVTEQNLRFQGQYLDRETGLHYNTFRYYDPIIAHFTQPDPIGLNGGINLYQYAPNPLGWVDPFGLSCSTDASSLRKNMLARGKFPPTFKNSAHHIVLSNSKDIRMVALRNKMDDLGININHSKNGVFLPSNSKVAASAGTLSPPHSKIHTNAYNQKVFERLNGIMNKKDFLRELDNISSEILSGIF